MPPMLCRNGAICIIEFDRNLAALMSFWFAAISSILSFVWYSISLFMLLCSISAMVSNRHFFPDLDLVVVAAAVFKLLFSFTNFLTKKGDIY